MSEDEHALISLRSRRYRRLGSVRKWPGSRWINTPVDELDKGPGSTRCCHDDFGSGGNGLCRRDKPGCDQGKPLDNAARAEQLSTVDGRGLPVLHPPPCFTNHYRRAELRDGPEGDPRSPYKQVAGHRPALAPHRSYLAIRGLGRDRQGGLPVRRGKMLMNSDRLDPGGRDQHH